jgi:shikimate kinase
MEITFELMRKTKRPVVLVGYMAAGKTTIAKELAQKWGSQAVDLDEEIERQTGKTPARWITEKGEVAFRKAEAQVLRTLPWDAVEVLSVGGGTPCYAGNMEYLKERAWVVYVQWPLATLVERLKNDPASRPLIAGVAADDLPAFVGAHLLERNGTYGLAHQILRPAHQDGVKEVVAQLDQLARSEGF